MHDIVPAYPPNDGRLAAQAQLVAGVVGYATGASPARILAVDRGSAVVCHGRRLAMYLLHGVFAMSLAQVAVVFGRDRSTVTLSLRVVEDRREDPAFDDWLENLEDLLRAAPTPRTVVEGEAEGGAA